MSIEDWCIDCEFKKFIGDSRIDSGQIFRCPSSDILFKIRGKKISGIKVFDDHIVNMNINQLNHLNEKIKFCRKKQLTNIKNL